jgi:hypothetical protein
MTTIKFILEDGSSHRLFLRDALFHKQGATVKIADQEFSETRQGSIHRVSFVPFEKPEFEKECLGWLRNIVSQ